MELWQVFVTIASASSLAASLFTLLVQHRLAKQLETHRVLLQRSSTIHELRITALCDLYAFLYRTQELLRALHAPPEKRDERDAKFISTFTDARDHSLKNRLLLPASLTIKVETLFEQLSSARMELAFAFDENSPNGPERKTLFDKFRQQVSTEIPAILASIEAEARELIYGDK